MSRPRSRREAAALKREPLDVPDDDSEQFDWMDVEQPCDDVSGHALEPKDEQGEQQT